MLLYVPTIIPPNNVAMWPPLFCLLFRNIRVLTFFFGGGRDGTFRLVFKSNQNGWNFYNDVFLSSFLDRSAIMCGGVFIAIAELGEMGYMVDHYA